MKKLLGILLISICHVVFPQKKGIIKGVATDKEMNNDPLPYVNIFIKNTSIGTTTDMEGKYKLLVKPGNYVLVFSFIGYKTQEKQIVVKEGQTIVFNQVMSANQGISLDDVEIKATTNKEKESALLLEQKKAVSIKTTIGAQELSKKGVSNLANAVTKVTGVSKEEGSNGVYVRGLGDRYNSTMLNGLPLPSNNPSLKNITLNVFSTDILQAIDVNKTYSSQIYGDFAGASINIISKQHTGKPNVEVKLGTGLNSSAIGEEYFYLQDGPTFLGFYNRNYPKKPLAGYQFVTSWDKKTKSPVNGNISIKGGKNFQVGKQGKLSVFGTASFSNGFTFKQGISRRGISVNKIIRTDYNFKSYSYQTNSAAMLNVLYKANNNHSYQFNSLFVNSSVQSLEDYLGIISLYDNAGNGGGFVRRTTFDRTFFSVNQLLGKNRISEKWDTQWAVAFNKVKNSIPNRRQNILVPMDNNNPNGDKKASNLATSDNNRFFQNLNENEYAVNSALNYHFNKNKDDKYKGKITLGVSGRFKKVNFDAVQFNFNINKYISQPRIDIDNLDAYFNQNSLNEGYFKIRTFRGEQGDLNALNPQMYKGRQIIFGGFAQGEYQFNKKFTAVVGLRFEYIQQKIRWKTVLDPLGGKDKLTKKDFLPSISLKYKLNEKQNLKFAASKSYTLPQFKERAKFQFSEINQDKFGNPYLRESTNYNADVRWEFFPKSNELISLTGFGKIIENPINEVVVASATNDISYVNSGKKATIVGVELEVRKALFNHTIKQNDMDLSSRLTAGFNASYMYTDQDFDRQKIIRETNNTLNVNFTHSKGKLTGASDLLMNADISYLKEFSSDKNILATLTFAYFSDRIYALGSAGEGDLIDKPVGTLDFILKSKVSKRINIGLSVKNILNPIVKRIQNIQNVDVLTFKKGINIGFSLTYKL